MIDVPCLDDSFSSICQICRKFRRIIMSRNGQNAGCPLMSRKSLQYSIIVSGVTVGSAASWFIHFNESEESSMRD
jgi:hypothetical protein